VLTDRGSEFCGNPERSVAAPIANREQQKSTGDDRKCNQLFLVEHEGGGAYVSPGFDRMCSHILPGPSGERSVRFDSAPFPESQIDHLVMAITDVWAVSLQHRLQPGGEQMTPKPHKIA
jgi:hypothetical protein